MGLDTPSTNCCRKNFREHLVLPIQGWQISIISVKYQGVIYLEEGFRAKQRSEYFIEGSKTTGPILPSCGIDDEQTFSRLDDHLFLVGGEISRDTHYVNESLVEQ